MQENFKVDTIWKTIIWRQFGAAIDMLEKALLACPEELWSNRTRRPEFWYIAYHTLFWLDFYLSESVEGFTPPNPFTLDELDPSGRLPSRVYTKEELLTYLEHGRKKCQTTIANLTDEKAHQLFRYGRIELNFAELLLYNMRHVQHHAGQLNLLLRQTIDSVPRWIVQAKNSSEVE